MTVATIVVTCYQQRAYLRDAVRSALAQDAGDVRVVVVDDGSTDCPQEVLGGLDGVMVLRKDNGGQASAWNASRDFLAGEAVIFLDGDDLLAPDTVRRALPLLRRGAVKVHGALAVIDGSGAPAGPDVPRRALDDGDLGAVVAEAGPTVLGWPPTSGNTWALSFLTTYLPVPAEDFRVSPDVYLCSLAAAAGRVAALEGPVGSWRLHGANASNDLDLLGRTERECAHWQATFPAVARVLADRGRPVGAAALSTWHGWPFRLRSALHRLARLLPADAVVVLLDEDQWAAGTTVLGRTRLHLHGAGDYAGPPSSAEDALALLGARRDSGATHLVTAWPAAWWLDHFGLATVGQMVHTDDDLVVRRL